MTESATASRVIERHLLELPPKEYWDDVRWSEEHYAELVVRYPNQWVAIVNGEIISAGSDLGRVVDEARTKTGRKDFPRIFIGWQRNPVFPLETRNTLPTEVTEGLCAAGPVTKKPGF